MVLFLEGEVIEKLGTWKRMVSNPKELVEKADIWASGGTQENWVWSINYSIKYEPYYIYWGVRLRDIEEHKPIIEQLRGGGARVQAKKFFSEYLKLSPTTVYIDLFYVNDVGVIGAGVIELVEVDAYNLFWPDEKKTGTLIYPIRFKMYVLWLNRNVLLNPTDPSSWDKDEELTNVLYKYKRIGSLQHIVEENAVQQIKTILRDRIAKYHGLTMKLYGELHSKAIEGEPIKLVELPITRVIVEDKWKELTLDSIRSVLEKNALVFDEHVLISILASLKSHRHVLLMGPPGTGKSRLVHAIAEAVDFEVYSCTANSSWTRYDFIGGPVLGREGKLVWKSGCLLRALARHIVRDRDKGWILLVEELNRAEADKVLAEFFTMFPSSNPKEWIIPYGLVDEIMKYFDEKESDEETRMLVNAIRGGVLKEVQGGYRVPSDFRVFVTINTFDRAYLFTLGYALQRRFAVVEVNPPENFDLEKKIVLSQLQLQGISSDKVKDIVEEIIGVVREIREVTGRLIGTSIIIEASKTAYSALSLKTTSVKEAIDQALKTTLVSQLEGLEEDKLSRLEKLAEDKGYKLLAKSIGGLKIV